MKVYILYVVQKDIQENDDDSDNNNIYTQWLRAHNDNEKDQK